jgi:hypothetical protein
MNTLRGCASRHSLDDVALRALGHDIVDWLAMRRDPSTVPLPRLRALCRSTSSRRLRGTPLRMQGSAHTSTSAGCGSAQNLPCRATADLTPDPFSPTLRCGDLRPKGKGSSSFPSPRRRGARGEVGQARVPIPPAPTDEPLRMTAVSGRPAVVIHIMTFSLSNTNA